MVRAIRWRNFRFERLRCLNPTYLFGSCKFAVIEACDSWFNIVQNPMLLILQVFERAETLYCIIYNGNDDSSVAPRLVCNGAIICKVFNIQWIFPFFPSLKICCNQPQKKTHIHSTWKPIKATNHEPTKKN